MARYIDAEKLYTRVKEKTNPYGKPTLDYESGVKMLNMIKESDKADVVEVKHGEWVHSSRGFDVSGDYECSLCQSPSGIKHFYNGEKYLFCPDCGAKMDGTPKERGGEK